VLTVDSFSEMLSRKPGKSRDVDAGFDILLIVSADCCNELAT
jgi:hypothetical protein